MNHSSSLSRRSFLGSLAADVVLLPLLAAPSAQAADLPHLGEDDPTAKALGYVPDASKLTVASESTYKPGSHCGSCVLYQGGTAEWGACGIYPGKAVHISGWCRSYSPKAA